MTLVRGANWEIYSGVFENWLNSGQVAGHVARVADVVVASARAGAPSEVKPSVKLKNVQTFQQASARDRAGISLRIPVGLVVAGDGLTRERKGKAGRPWMYNPALTSEYGNANTPAMGWFRRALATAGGRYYIASAPPRGGK